MEAILSFIPVPVAVILMAAGFISLAVGGIRLGYKATVKDLALELVEKAELSIMGSGQGAKKKKQVFAALRAKCPAVIQCRGLRHEDIGMLGMPTPAHLVVGARDLGSRTAEVHGAGRRDAGIGPRHRAGEREVHLRGGAAVAEPGERAAIPARQLVAAEGDERPGRDIEEPDLRGRQLPQRADLGIRHDLAAVHP